MLTYEEAVEMDACVMEGNALNAGAVTLIRHIKNPIQLARDVMQKSRTPCLLVKGLKGLPSKNAAMPTPSRTTFLQTAATKNLKQ